MARTLRQLMATLCILLIASPVPALAGGSPVQSEVVETEAGGLMLVQTLLVEAPVERVWAAYTTGDGWMAWAAPVAEVDLRPGGTILTHYEADKKIGDPGTNTLHIVNYVPRRVLTLKADVSDRWPEVMKADADNLMNVIVFDAVDDATTRISSYGVGYSDDPAYDKLLEFFIPANEGLLLKLQQYLEE